MPREVLFPRTPGRNSFPNNLNVDTRYPGRLTPSFGHVILSTTDRLHYATNTIETKAPTAIGNNPRQYCGINKTLWRLDNGAETGDQVFNDVVQGSTIGDSGVGTAQLVVGFGSSTNPRNAHRDPTAADSTWTTNTSATYAQFWLICKAGPDMYAVTDAGVAILGEYRVSKCPLGNVPDLAASWGNGFEVGTPEWAITGLAAIGDSVCAAKPDGLYYYDDQTKRFKNVLSFLEAAPHAVNGKGLKAVPNGVLYPTHDGRLYFFDGVAVQDVSPDKNVDLPRYAGQARITAIASYGDEVYCAREAYQNTTQGMGLKFITYINGTFTDETANVTDGSLATGANLGASAATSFGKLANDRLLVGSTIPLEGFCFRCTTNVNAAVVALGTPRYSNGTAGTIAPFTSSFTGFTAIRDGSILSVAGTSLVNTGFPSAASNATISWTDINSFDLSTSTALTMAGVNGGNPLTRYWYAIAPAASGTGMTANTTIDEVEIVPSAAGIPITAANDFTHRWRAGGLTEILVAKIKGTAAYQWHSVYQLEMGGGVWGMQWHSGRLGQASGAENMGQQLILWGRYARAAITEGPTRDVARTIAPITAQYGTTKPGPLLDLAPGGTWLTDGEPLNQWRKKRIKGFWLMGDFVQQNTDILRIYVQMDENIDIVKAVDLKGAPWFVAVDESFQGMKMQAWLEINDVNVTDIIAPQITSVIVDYEYVTSDMEAIPIQAPLSLPPTT